MIDKPYILAKNNTLSKVLTTLSMAMEKPFAYDLERDGAIQRFEYCFELCC